MNETSSLPYCGTPAEPAKACLEVWPVIHLSTGALAERAADLAFSLGAAGVFVISMDHHDELVGPVAMSLKRRHPTRRIGVNYLSLQAPVALQRALDMGLDATWSDHPGLRSDWISTQALEVADLLRQHPDHLFFGSVAFKYQAIDPDPPGAALRALGYGMIPTTSGPATGSAPAAAKLQGMRNAIGPDAPLALASGVTPDNVRELGQYLTYVLVATGISRTEHEFDEVLLSQLMQRVAEPGS